MKKVNHLILIELMSAVFFFAICSVVIVTVFMKTSNLSDSSERLRQARTLASKEAEYVAANASTDDLELSKKTYYDKDWNEVSSDGSYVLTVELKKDQYMLSGKIQVSEVDSKEGIYTLKVSEHIPRRRGQ